MDLPDEEIASLLHRRADLLGRIAHSAARARDREPGKQEQRDQGPSEVAALKLKLAELEHYLARAGLSFDDRSG
ncbi:MAG: hypothetical protein ACM3ZV_02155 [Bacillota bacterium]